MTASVVILTGRYTLAAVRGEKPWPPGPFAYDLARWVFVEGENGALVARLELTDDEEREVADWFVAHRSRRAA